MNRSVARITTLSTALVLVLALGGCARFPGGIAPSNVPLDPNGYTILGPVAASDCKVNLLGVIPVSGGNHVADALSAALRQRGAAIALIQISVDYVSKYFILWSQSCTEVRGIAVAAH